MIELKTATAAELEARKAAIAQEVEAEDADLDALEAEIRSINEELETRKAEEAKKVEIRKAVAEGEGKTIEKLPVEERKEMTNEEIRNSKQYIDAYAEYVKNGDDKEVRALLTVNVATGPVPVPVLV